MDKLLTIIIVNWNTSELLHQCLESIFIDNPNYKVIVVDNGSTDNSVKMVTTVFPQVELIYSTVNLGFAKANNLAIQKSDSEYVCLLNSDTIVSTNCFNSMLRFMLNHAEAVACAPALRLPTGKLQTGGAGFELSLFTAFNYFFFLSKFFPYIFKGFFIDQEPYVKQGQPTKVDWLAGACLMVRRSVINKAGALDESFFMYAEDAEWCDRLREYGSIYYLPNLEIIHYHGASSNKNDKVSTKWLEATFKFFYSKSSLLQARIFQAIVGCGFMIRLLAYFLLSVNDKKYLTNVKAMSIYFRFTSQWKYLE